MPGVVTTATVEGGGGGGVITTAGAPQTERAHIRCVSAVTRYIITLSFRRIPTSIVLEDTTATLPQTAARYLPLARAKLFSAQHILQINDISRVAVAESCTATIYRPENTVRAARPGYDRNCGRTIVTTHTSHDVRKHFCHRHTHHDSCLNTTRNNRDE